MDSRETLVEWLRDAHAMEAATIGNLEKQLDRLEDFPQVQARFRQNLEESRRQRERIEECLKTLNADTSTLKDLATKFASNVQIAGTAMAGDEPVKQMLGAHAYKHFEVASYRSLAAAAASAGEQRIASVCEENLREDQDMADFILKEIPEVTRRYLSSPGRA